MLAPRTNAGTQVTFGGTNTNLSGTTGYGGSRPTNTSDVLLTTTATTLTNSSGSTVMESLSASNTLNYQITSTTSTANNYTLTFGNGAGFTNANDNTANDLIYLGGSGSLSIFGPNNSTGSGTLSLVLASSGNFDVTTTNTTGLQIQAVVSGAFGITKTGSGFLLLGAANTFSGSFAASAGSTSLYTNNALGGVSGVSISGTAYVYTGVGLTNAINDSAAVTINGTTGELDLSGGAETVASLAGTSTTATLNIGDYTDTSTSPGTVYTGGFTVGDGTSTTFAGIISGTRAAAGSILTKQGSGTLTLTGSNTYTGVTSITGGTLATTLLANGGSTSGIGKSSNAAVNLLLGNGTTLQYTGATANSDRLFTINGTAAGNSATLDASGTGALNLTNTGSIAYGTTNQTRTLVLTGTNTGANTLSATIADNGSGATTVTKSGAGTWVLSGTNTYTRGTNINGGVLALGSGIQALGGGGTIGTIGFGGGTLQYSASNTTDYSSRFSGGANQLFSIDTNGQNVSYGSSLKSSSGGSLTKLGTGTLPLSGTASTFANGTTVTGGRLLFTNTTGTSVGTGSVSIGAAGTLASGSGTTATVTGLVNTAATTSTIAPGATAVSNIGTIGALTMSGGLNLMSGAVIPFDLSTVTASDLIKITGGTFTGATNAGAVTFNFNSLNAQPGTYALISYSGATASGVDLADFTASGAPGTFAFNANGTELDFITTVPEPATCLGSLLLLGTAGWNQRRRVGGLFAGRRSRAMA